MIKANILKKGDEVLSITDRFLAIKRKNGEVDIFNLMYNDENEIIIDPVKTTVIGYGEGLVEKTLDNSETTIFAF